MAEEVVITGSAYRPKIRSLWGVALLPFVTFGIYFLVWYYKVNKEMVVLAVSLGSFVVVPAIISLIHTFQRIQATQRLARDGGVLDGWIGLVLYLVCSPAMCAYMQSGLNESWQALRSGPPVEPPYPTTPYSPSPTGM